MQVEEIEDGDWKEVSKIPKLYSTIKEETTTKLSPKLNSPKLPPTTTSTAQYSPKEGEDLKNNKNPLDNPATKPGVARILAAFGVKKSKPQTTAHTHSAKKDVFLIDACQQGSLDLAKKLIIENGCSPNLKNSEGKSLIQLAMEGGHEDIVLYLFIEQKALLPTAKGYFLRSGGNVNTLKVKKSKLHPVLEEEGDIFHIQLMYNAVIKNNDKEKGFQLVCEAISHSCNATISALLFAEMYGEIAKKQPTHRHVLEANKDILQKVAYAFLDVAKPDHVVEVLGGKEG